MQLFIYLQNVFLSADWPLRHLYVACKTKYGDKLLGGACCIAQVLS